MFDNITLKTGMGLLLAGMALLNGCDRELEVERVYFCDNWRSEECTMKMEPDRTYEISIPESRKKTWFDLGYYMYFHSRQTPGIRVELSHKPSLDRVDALRNGLRCSYRLRKGERFVEGEMEGVRMDKDGGGFWCFDYLGTMLVNYHKKYNSIQEPPETDFFPVHIEMHYRTGLTGIEGGEEATVSVIWKVSDQNSGAAVPLSADPH